MNPETAFVWSCGSGLIEICLTAEQAESMPLSGDCEDAARALRAEIQDQLSKIDDETLRRELGEYGAWDDDELQDREWNEIRLCWLAGSDVAERPGDYRN